MIYVVTSMSVQYDVAVAIFMPLIGRIQMGAIAKIHRNLQSGCLISVDICKMHGIVAILAGRLIANTSLFDQEVLCVII